MVALSQNIEFIENKGQWDEHVRFMGQVPNGAFFIHNNGFTVLQHMLKGGNNCTRQPTITPSMESHFAT